MTWTIQKGQVLVPRKPDSNDPEQIRYVMIGEPSAVPGRWLYTSIEGRGGLLTEETAYQHYRPFWLALGDEVWVGDEGGEGPKSSYQIRGIALWVKGERDAAGRLSQVTLKLDLSIGSKGMGSYAFAGAEFSEMVWKRL